MRRVIVPALMAIAMVASSSVNASAFGLFDRMCGNSCDSCCDVEPTCGCEAPACCEPTCAAPACCEPTCAAPTCGCEVVDPCCGAPRHRHGGFLSRLFGKRNRCCDSGCCEPACGCEAPAPCCEPACGCEVVDPCCSAPRHRHGGFLSNLFGKRNRCCDSGCCEAPCCEPTCAAPAPCCEPTCGCEAPACCEPTCGCEPSCGL